MASWLHRFVRFVALRGARARVRRDLDGVSVAGLDDVRRLAAERPVLLAANHVAWWDSVLLALLTEAIGHPARFVMDDANLRAHPWFEAFGAIGLDRGPAAAVAALRTARTWLQQPGHLLWFFPQGRQRPAHLRPLDLKPGVARLAADPRVAVVPVVFHYAFADAPRPAATVWFGPPLPPTPTVEEVDVALRAGLQATDAHLLAPAPAFEPLWPARPERDLGDAVLGLLWRFLG